MFEGLLRSREAGAPGDGRAADRIIANRLALEGLEPGGVPFRIAMPLLKLISPLVRGLARAGVSPDSVSILSVFLSLLAGIALVRGAALAGVVLFVAAGLCDLLDGWVARIREMASRRGEVLDALCDRISEAFLYGAIAWGFQLHASGRVASFGFFSALFAWFGAYLMSYASALIDGAPERVRKGCSRGMMRRGERSLVLLGTILIFPMDPRVSALLLLFQGGLAAFSALQRLMQLRLAYQVHDQTAAGRTPEREPWLLQEIERTMLAPGIQRLAVESGIVLQSGSGSRLRDESGAEYIDWVAGMGVASIGHSHAHWARAVSAQASVSAVGSYTTRVRVRFLERMRAFAPVELDLIQLYSGGSEAVESAIRLAQESTGRRRIAHFSGSFHGKTRGALAVMGSAWKKPWGPYEDLNPLELPFPDCGNCPLGLDAASCEYACVERVESLLSAARGETAALIFEPVQGTAGNIIPPPGFWARIEQICRRLDILMIADEMITGFGRTGRFWAIEHSGIRPDLLLAGKGMAGGFPISAILLSTQLARTAPHWSAVSGSSSSYGGNPMACAAALATLEVIDSEGLVRNAELRGELMLDLLQDLRKRRGDLINSVRGAGLLIGMDLSESLDENDRKRLFQETLRQGVVTLAFSSRVRINPPLCISEPEVRESVARFERALNLTFPENQKAS